MEKATPSRRDFIKRATMAGLVASQGASWKAAEKTEAGKRVGVIGLDTSHSVAFSKVINSGEPDMLGYQVVAAYPHGSRDIESSVSRIPRYTEEMKGLGVEIVASIADLLDQVDVVLLETNDGRLHLEQASEVLAAGKRVFIDKPIAASLSDAIKIFALAQEAGVEVWSASSLRYIKGLEALDEATVVGAEAFSPASIEQTHPDLFWYGVHGVETLYTVMGTGCEQVSRVHTKDTDMVVGVWEDGRMGTFRGTRSGKHAYGGRAFTTEGNVLLGPYNGYRPLVEEIVKYFDTGVAPIPPAETIEIFAFMAAADVSKERNGAAVTLDEVMAEADAESGR